MSVREYLVSERIKGREMVFFGVDEVLAHSVLARTCLAYLLHLGGFPFLDESTIDSFPLAPYAAEYWIPHMRLGCDDGSCTSQMTARLFSPDNTAALTNWVRLHDPDDPGEQDLKRPAEDVAAPLYYASLYGLQEVAQQLLGNGAKVDARGGKYGNALQAASHRGYGASVEMLLKAGADVNMQGGEDGSALQAAARRGHISIIQLLLSSGANANTHGGHYGNALQAASHTGMEGAVRLLLGHGADVNAQGGHYGFSLQAASHAGHDIIVDLLLESEAEVSAVGGYYGNAFQAALSGGNGAIAISLLDPDNEAGSGTESPDLAQSLTNLSVDLADVGRINPADLTGFVHPLSSHGSIIGGLGDVSKAIFKKGKKQHYVGDFAIAKKIATDDRHKGRCQNHQTAKRHPRPKEQDGEGVFSPLTGSHCI